MSTFVVSCRAIVACCVLSSGSQAFGVSTPVPNDVLDIGAPPDTPVSSDVDVDIGLDLSPFNGIEYLVEERAVTGWVLQGLKSQVPVTYRDHVGARFFTVGQARLW